MPTPHHPQSDRLRLELQRAPLGGSQVLGTQDLMAFPVFSIIKNKRLTPIDFRAGAISIRIEAGPEHGMATIWDADVLIWAAYHIAAARDHGTRPSRVLTAMPEEILSFAGRGKAMCDVQRLKAALDRLQSTSVTTCIRHPRRCQHHRFSWIDGGKETSDASGRTFGIELTLPEWFFTSILDGSLDLTVDREYFALWSGLERWLYRFLCKHRGRRVSDWNFDLAHLHARSGSLSPLQQFVHELGEIARRQTLPGYRLRLSRDARGTERLLFAPLSDDPSTHAQHRIRGAVACPTRPYPATGGMP